MKRPIGTSWIGSDYSGNRVAWKVISDNKLQCVFADPKSSWEVGDYFYTNWLPSDKWRPYKRFKDYAKHFI